MAQDTYLDNFNTTSYSNNNGTLNFAANWIETNDDNDPDDGDIDIKDNELRFDDISDNNSSIRRALNLSGATSAVLPLLLLLSIQIVILMEFGVQVI